MCVICVKEKGVLMPTTENIRAMWDANPHGAGFMFARNGKVFIRKGFMTLDDFECALLKENFTKDDVIIMHFRIATQGGINPEMTHPFALVNKIENTKCLNALCDIGIAHNGIIRLTTDFKEKEYSDTAIFITNYISKLIRKKADFYDAEIREMIYELGKSKFAFLNGEGDVFMLGDFRKVNGLYYSNLNHEIDRRWLRPEPIRTKGYVNNLFGKAV